MSQYGFVKARGWIEVIVGSMYSGKTEELIRRIRRAEFARQGIQVFKPVIDQRYSMADVVSHNQSKIAATPVQKADEIFALLLPDTKVIGIDEGQFFNEDLVEVVQSLAEQGYRVIIAGLDTDWLAKPFGPIPHLMAIAENVSKQHAVCMVCGQEASRTQRIGGGLETIQIGAHDTYEARCREHFKPAIDRSSAQIRASLTVQEIQA